MFCWNKQTAQASLREKHFATVCCLKLWYLTVGTTELSTPLGFLRGPGEVTRLLCRENSVMWVWMGPWATWSSAWFSDWQCCTWQGIGTRLSLRSIPTQANLWSYYMPENLAFHQGFKTLLPLVCWLWCGTWPMYVKNVLTFSKWVIGREAGPLVTALQIL